MAGYAPKAPAQIISAAVASVLLGGCHYAPKVIGYLPTEPVSIPVADTAFGALHLDVGPLIDTVALPGVVVRDLQRTTERALMMAFRSTFQEVGPALGQASGHELRMLKLSIQQVLVDHHAHSELVPSPFSFGPPLSSSTKEIAIHVLETRYKAVLLHKGRLLAVYEAGLTTPKGPDLLRDLTTAVERMAEELNTRVVRTVLAPEQAQEP